MSASNFGQLWTKPDILYLLDFVSELDLDTLAFNLGRTKKAVAMKFLTLTPDYSPDEYPHIDFTLYHKELERSKEKKRGHTPKDAPIDWTSRAFDLLKAENERLKSSNENLVEQLNKAIELIAEERQMIHKLSDMLNKK